MLISQVPVNRGCWVTFSANRSSNHTSTGVEYFKPSRSSDHQTKQEFDSQLQSISPSIFLILIITDCQVTSQAYCGHTREKFTSFPDIRTTHSCLNLILRRPSLRFLIPKEIESGKSSPILSASVKLVVKLSSTTLLGEFIPRLVFACLTEFLRKFWGRKDGSFVASPVLELNLRGAFAMSAKGDELDANGFLKSHWRRGALPKREVLYTCSGLSGFQNGWCWWQTVPPRRN